MTSVRPADRPAPLEWLLDGPLEYMAEAALEQGLDPNALGWLSDMTPAADDLVRLAWPTPLCPDRRRWIGVLAALAVREVPVRLTLRQRQPSGPPAELCVYPRFDDEMLTLLRHFDASTATGTADLQDTAEDILHRLRTGGL